MPGHEFLQPMEGNVHHFISNSDHSFLILSCFIHIYFIPGKHSLQITYRNEPQIHHVRCLQTPLSLVKGQLC